MSKTRTVTGLVVGAILTGAFGTFAASAEEPKCDKPVTRQVHGVHETTEGIGEGSPAQPGTDLAAGLVHGSETATCLLPV